MQENKSRCFFLDAVYKLKANAKLIVVINFQIIWSLLHYCTFTRTNCDHFNKTIHLITKVVGPWLYG